MQQKMCEGLLQSTPGKTMVGSLKVCSKQTNSVYQVCHKCGFHALCTQVLSRKQRVFCKEFQRLSAIYTTVS